MPQLYVIDTSGAEHGPFHSVAAAAKFVDTYLPGIEQDEDRTGLGWDIRADIHHLVGPGRPSGRLMRRAGRSSWRAG